MNVLNKIIVTVVVAILAFLFTAFSGEAASTMQAGIVSAIALVITGFLLFLDRLFETINSEQLFLISLGAFTGLIGGYYLVSMLKILGISFFGMETLGFLIPMVFFGMVGHMFARFPGLKVFGGGGGAALLPDQEVIQSREKILDTSVIIDGRILDIAETNFLEGPFIIPNFVLREIQLISDSPDPVKRNRGRRGLEMLNKLQQHGSVKVKISYADYSDTREVDAKLVKLSRETGGKLITNDFNLNKVAELQGVQVLNLNSLTNALKPVVLPGEEILIDVIKEGKDENQGIGYLEDGTMVVVENGRSLLSKTVRVNVTSIIQTAAGKMIFTRAAGTVEDSSALDEAAAHQNDNNRGRSGGRNKNRNNNNRNNSNQQYDESGQTSQGSGNSNQGRRRR